MRRLLILIIALLCLDSSKAQVRAGIKGGLNIAQVKHEGSDNNKARAGYHAGFLASIPLSGKVQLQPELLYSVKGYTSPATAYNGQGTVSLNYLSLPVLISYSPMQYLSVLLGPEFGYMLHARSKFDDNTVDVSRYYRDFDIGMDIGLSYSLSQRAGIDLRYNHGLKVLSDVVFTDAFGNIIGEGKTGANRVIQCGLYFLLGNKK